MSDFFDKIGEQLDEKYGIRKWHCDDILYDKSLPECVLEFLKVERSHAHGLGLEKKTLYATHEESRVRVTMASRFGDVGITYNLSKEIGYDKRVFLCELTDFNETP